ncbi:hypothetical protein [Paenibacillus kobensis]|uniref:hypothetical protein n=1 Tax=Paenibacillus kobensis TaxID=59841 RepID=UPI000FD98A49|nr:hypothetical protein [Paenibacillus kobensis]
MDKQAKLRTVYYKCKACGGSGTAADLASAAPMPEAHVRNDACERSEANGDVSVISGRIRQPIKPLYRPIADPNADDPFVEDPFSGYAPLRWRDRRTGTGSVSIRKSRREEALVYNAGYLGQENDHSIWLAPDEGSQHPVNIHANSCCRECDGAGVIRVEWKAELSLAPAFALLGVASCVAAYTERPLLMAIGYGAVMLVARLVRFKTERYFVRNGAELFTAKQKTGLHPVRHDCKCELADSYHL